MAEILLSNIGNSTKTFADMLQNNSLQKAFDPKPTTPGKANSLSALYGQIAWLTKILRGAGVPENLLAYCLAQIYFETGDITSNLAQKDNNFSGITFINKPYQDARASTNVKGFASYASPEKWAKDYVRILSLKGRSGRPIDAKNATEFLQALYSNGYFTKKDNERYSTGFNAKLRKVNEALTWARNNEAAGRKAMEQGGTTTAGDWTAADTAAAKKQEFKVWWADRSSGEKIGIGATAAVLAIILVKNLTK